jgi:hypothetical protein
MSAKTAFTAALPSSLAKGILEPMLATSSKDGLVEVGRPHQLPQRSVGVRLVEVGRHREQAG